MPILYLVGTPIGNLEDISLRALRVLGEVGLIAAEDTRTTGHLLSHYQIETPMLSYHDFSDQGRISQLIEALSAKDVALVTEAGMPGLSDPGYRLVKEAIEAGIEVVPVPGPSAATAALVSSGLPTDKFLFLGFLPRQRKARRELLTEVARLPYTLVLYEAPHRVLDMLADMHDLLGDRQLSIGRELTKLYEEIWRGSISQAIEYFGQGRIRGEFTVVVAGAGEEFDRWTETEVRESLAEQLSKGLKRKEAAEIVAQMSGWRKKEVYELSLSQRD
jgi:16S rRNA (cytidine1402-2'-O)-methyltransferase